jgi:MFS family permease
MERRMLGVFSVISFLVNMRTAVFVPFLSLYLKEELGASYTQVGVILTAMVVVNALFQVVWGWTSDRFAKRKHFLILGEGIPGIMFLSLPETTDITVLAIILTTVNIFWSMAAPTWNALIAEHSRPGERGELMGKITTCGGIGAITGLPIAANLIDNLGYAYFFYFCSLCMVLISFVSAFVKEPEGLGPSRRSLLSMEQLRTLYYEHRHFSIFTVLVLLSRFGTRLFEGFISLYAASLGAGVQHVSYLFMLRVGTETAFMIPMGKLSDRWGKVKILKISLVILALAVLLFAAAPVWWYLLLVVVLESVGYSGHYVSSFAILFSLTPKETRGTYMGFHSMITSLSSVGSSVGGSVADRYGLRILFFISFIFSAFVVFFFVNWLHKSCDAINQSQN